MARPADIMIAWTLVHPATEKRFSHSTWQGEVIDPTQLARNQPTHVPQPSSTANERNTVLSYCDEERTVSQVQDAVQVNYPDLFPSHAEIARFVTTVLRRDTL